MFSIDDLGNRMKAIRKHKKMTQAEVAKHMQISTNMYSLLERGERKVNLEHIFQFAECVDVPVSDIFLDCDNEALIKRLFAYHVRLSPLMKKEMLQEDIEI